MCFHRTIVVVNKIIFDHCELINIFNINIGILNSSGSILYDNLTASIVSDVTFKEMNQFL